MAAAPITAVLGSPASPQKSLLHTPKQLLAERWAIGRRTQLAELPKDGIGYASGNRPLLERFFVPSCLKDEMQNCSNAIRRQPGPGDINVTVFLLFVPNTGQGCVHFTGVVCMIAPATSSGAQRNSSTTISLAPARSRGPGTYVVIWGPFKGQYQPKLKPFTHTKPYMSILLQSSSRLSHAECHLQENHVRVRQWTLIEPCDANNMFMARVHAYPSMNECCLCRRHRPEYWREP